MTSPCSHESVGHWEITPQDQRLPESLSCFPINPITLKITEFPKEGRCFLLFASSQHIWSHYVCDNVLSSNTNAQRVAKYARRSWRLQSSSYAQTVDLKVENTDATLCRETCSNHRAWFIFPVCFAFIIPNKLCFQDSTQTEGWIKNQKTTMNQLRWVNWICRSSWVMRSAQQAQLCCQISVQLLAIRYIPVAQIVRKHHATQQGEIRWRQLLCEDAGKVGLSSQALVPK